MVRRLKGPASVMVVLALLALTTSVLAQEPASAAAIDSSSSKLVVTRVISPVRQRAALAYWTREAIASAKPMEMPAQIGTAEVNAAELEAAMQAEQAVSGPPGFTAAGAAAPGADRVSQAAYSSDWAALEGNVELAAEPTDLPAGTSQVYTSYIANGPAPMQSLYPHRWVGRVSFQTPEGTSYCSGTSISGNVMLTAAHCLYDTTNNRWYSNWVLVPAYRAGSAPFGVFAATQCWVLTSWVNLTGPYNINGWARHDVGVCKMGTNSSGTTLNNAVGWMGRQWNAPYIRHFHNVGYPFRNYANNPISGGGQYLFACVAESFQQNVETRGMGCSWGGGISGGPWIAGYAPGAVSGFADGVNSGIYLNVQNIYGPRFNSSNIVPLCNAAVC